MKILNKAKGKFKDFFDQSKKLVQPPKELPNLKVPLAPPAKNQQMMLQNTNNQVMVKTEMPAQAHQPFPQRTTTPLALPKIELPKIPTNQPYQAETRTQPYNHDDMRRFEEAINSISIDVINSESTKETPSEQSETGRYTPLKSGEGYFSEIEHFLKNNDAKQIIDDILGKDFLTSMKDYHDTRLQGKPFYLHSEDLKNKIEAKINELRHLEAEWHAINKEAEEKNRRKKSVEKLIDEESEELKALFTQIKINQALEKEAPKDNYFKLRNRQELKNLNDLRKALSYMTDDEFNNHVTSERNDFANWAADALKLSEIAGKIRTAKTKEELQETLKNPA